MRYITPLRVLRLTRTPPHFHARNYAAISASLTLNLSACAELLRNPKVISFTNCRHINLIPNDHSPWEYKLKTHSEACHSQLSHILGSLESSPAISTVTLNLEDVLALPLNHRYGLDADSIVQRSPVSIFKSIGISACCIDLGHWVLHDYPTITIYDPPTRRILQHLRTSADIDAWLALVAGSTDPTLQAGEYTADFHSRDVRCEHDGDVTITLGPYGSGKLSAEDADDLSVSFASDLQKNTTFFERETWRPRMYDEFQREGEVVTSNLLSGDDVRDEVTEVIIKSAPDNFTPEQFEEFKAQVAEMVNCKEDEEVVFAGNVCRKRKRKTDAEANESGDKQEDDDAKGSQ